MYDFGAPPAPKTSVLAILSLVFAFVCQPVGFVLGIVAMILIGRSQGRIGGMGIAIGGTVASGVMGFFCVPMIAAVAIPGLLRSRVAANETSAIGSLKGICTGMEQYRSATGGYAPLEVLGGFKAGTDGKKCDACPYIPTVLGQVDGNGVSVKSGYCFKAYLRDASFVVYAWPMERNRTGVRVFAVDEQGQVYCLPRGATPWSGSADAPPLDAFDARKWVPVG
jgi:hypothetical protein